MKKYLSVKCEIWDTQYTLINNVDSSVTVKVPYKKWVTDSEATLAFETVKIIDPTKIKTLHWMFDNGEYCTSGDMPMSITDVIYY